MDPHVLDEFQPIPSDYLFGTRKLYARRDFLPPGSALADDEGDFIGRLRTLFGSSDSGDYVLRHLETGWIVTAYAARSGPSYGGGVRYPTLPAPDPAALMIAAARSYSSQIDPELAAVVARLDGLIATAPPADWHTIKTFDGIPYRVGVRCGRSFVEDLGPHEGLLVLLDKAELAADTLYGPSAAHWAIAFYFMHEAELAPRRRSVLPRLRAAYVRLVVGLEAGEQLDDDRKTWGARLESP